MPALAPLTPGATVTLSASGTTARVALPSKRGDQIRIANPAGGQIVFVKFGDATVTAAVTDTPVLVGSTDTFTVPPGMTYVAGITSTGTATIYFTSGDGQ